VPIEIFVRNKWEIMNSETSHTDGSSQQFSGQQVFLFVGLAVLAVALVTAWWVNQYLYAATFEPTQLTKSEQRSLDSKMAQLRQVAESGSSSSKPKVSSPDGPIEPEPYSEEGASREIQLTEREVNSLIAKDVEMAKHVAVDLADNLVSVKLVVPVTEEMPIVGGKTLKMNFGVELSYANGKPVVAMQGISLGGVPLPSAWWGDIKHINLVEEFGGPGGFWDQFAKGVQDLKIQDGQLRITLKE
jgi:cytoskeletal protein RodZ